MAALRVAASLEAGVQKFFKISDINGKDTVKVVYVKPQNGLVNVAQVAEAVHAQMGGRMQRLLDVPMEAYCFFRAPPIESQFTVDMGLPLNEILEENDGSASAPLYLATSKVAWISLVKRSATDGLKTSVPCKVILLENRLVAEALDQQAEGFQCVGNNSTRYFVVHGARRILLQSLADGYLDYSFHDAGSEATPRKIIVADDEYYDEACTFSDSTNLKKYFKFEPEPALFLTRTFVQRFEAASSTSLHSHNDAIGMHLEETLGSIRSHLRRFKEVAGSENEMAVRSMISPLLYAAVQAHNLLKGGASEQLLPGDIMWDMAGPSHGRTRSAAEDGSEEEAGKQQRVCEEESAGQGEALQSSVGPSMGQLRASESPREGKGGLKLVEEVVLSAIVSTGEPECKFIKVSGKIDFAVCHRAGTRGSSTDAALVILEAKTMDTLDKYASLVQAYVETRAIMEVRRRSGRGFLGRGEKSMKSYIVLTNGIEWNFYMLEVVQGENGTVEIKGTVDSRGPVMLTFDKYDRPTNVEEVLGLLVEMVAKGVESSPRASNEQSVGGRQSNEAPSSMGDEDE